MKRPWHGRHLKIRFIRGNFTLYLTTNVSLSPGPLRRLSGLTHYNFPPRPRGHRRVSLLSKNRNTKQPTRLNKMQRTPIPNFNGIHDSSCQTIKIKRTLTSLEIVLYTPQYRRTWRRDNGLAYVLKPASVATIKITVRKT